MRRRPIVITVFVLAVLFLGSFLWFVVGSGGGRVNPDSFASIQNGMTVPEVSD